MQSTEGNGKRYVGTITEVPKDGFAFISIKSVRTTEGHAHDLKTEEDIFISRASCVQNLQVGLLVSFETEEDERRTVERGRPCLKAVRAEECKELMRDSGIIPGFSIAGAAQVTLVVHTGPRDYHDQAAENTPPADDLQKACANGGLLGIPGDGEAINNIPDDEDGVRKSLEGYLYAQFPGLQAVEGLRFSLEGEDDAFDALVKQEQDELRGFSSASAADQLGEVYLRFKSLRRMLRWILENGFLRPGTGFHPAMLASLIKLVEGCGTGKAKEGAVNAVTMAVTFMANHKGGSEGASGSILRANSVLPMSRLPEIFMACPVWYLTFRDDQERVQTEEVRKTRKPDFSPAVEFFSYALGANQRWIDTFGVWNRMLRGRSLYPATGDFIPRHIRTLITEASKAFDYVVLATPFNDQAGLNSAWVPQYNPYVLGFSRCVPNSFFVLGRFSDTGIRPGYDALLADTIGFLRSSLPNLKQFNQKGDSTVPWVDGGKHSYSRYVEQRLVGGDWHGKGRDRVYFHASTLSATPPLGDYLIKQMSRLLAAYDAGHVFDWLRGEWELPAVPPPVG